MAQESQTSRNVGWLEASGLSHISRTLGFGLHPPKLGIALVAIIATIALGCLLDRIWTFYEQGVSVDAISQFSLARQVDQTYEEPAGKVGIFRVWREHEQQSITGLLRSSIPVLGSYVHVRTNLADMAYGVWWLVRHHVVYFALFALGALLIWSLAGGAICRIAAVQFARDEKITTKQALRYSWENLFGGFFLAPCIPVLFILITVILLVLGGMVLRIPVLGDLVSGLAFGLAIFGGFVISILLLGLLVGGSLFWPAIAVEGSDAFDSFSRGLSYTLSKPWRTIWYGAVATVFAAVCWVLLNVFTVFTLTITRGVVAFGTSPLGWWSRGDEGENISKLDLLWPTVGGAGSSGLYAWPNWQSLTWYEHFSAAIIGLYVLLVIGLLWSFLASFYYSGSTVIYYLLRRDVDGTDLEDIQMEEEQQRDVSEPVGAVAPRASEPAVRDSNLAPAPSTNDVSLPVVEGGKAAAPPPTPSPETEPSQPSASVANSPSASETGTRPTSEGSKPEP